ncbi:maleylpyruvate isomerase family mycothiol-dependent enzyme [Streptomyces sp. A7024]|uniref:Maleylpyruvate isomerase family mycothiol-dependent enzyme n=1 Tax=Streptomyces coryli TaxID=1128680 RepID=A0A6G4U909_9ACTN|nr:maleylpyruvate isomerase family mycothiol-dependent enzyme [Streptomyces coryli]
MTVHSSLQPYVDAWTHATTAISELVSPLADGEWHRASGLPGWSVKDVVSHIIGMECEGLGDPRPIHTLPVDLYHVKTEWQRYMEVQVDIRRHHTGPEMTSELEYVLIRRGRQLRNENRGPDDKVRGPLGRQVRIEDYLRDRAFDVWVHEQDLRRALGKPGNLDSAGALVARDLLVERLAKVVAKDAQAAPETVVVVDVTGALDFMRTVRVDKDGRGSVDGSVSLGPAVTLSTNWETYLRLATGRTTVAAVEEQVKVEGDQKLAAAILRNFAVTP